MYVYIFIYSHKGLRCASKFTDTVFFSTFQRASTHSPLPLSQAHLRRRRSRRRTEFRPSIQIPIAHVEVRTPLRNGVNVLHHPQVFSPPRRCSSAGSSSFVSRRDSKVVRKMYGIHADLALDHSIAEDEEDATWAVDKACSYVSQGKFERALSLLDKAERICPSVKGLSEIVAVTEVCYAATWSPCSCSTKWQQQKSPDWYQILKVDEKADVNTIKKRYRQLALLLHPDKNKHARAEEAFKLVSEAYEHLCDKQKRAIFNLERLQSYCKRCSSSRPETGIPTFSKGCRERLKGQAQASLHRGYFETHRAEWKIEREKLQMFREQAQARVDSLAQVLRERRSKWTEESLREKYQSKRVDRKVGKSDLASEEHFIDKDKLLRQLHNHMRTGKQLDQQTSSEFSWKSQELSGEGWQSSILANEFVEFLKSRRVLQRETPQVLQSVDGMLMRGERVTNASTVTGNRVGISSKLKNVRGAGTRPASDHENRANKSKIDSGKHEIHVESVRQCHGSSKDSKSGTKQVHEFGEESVVIDDFLAGLCCSPAKEYQRAGSCKESHFSDVPCSCMQYCKLSAHMSRCPKASESEKNISKKAAVECNSYIRSHSSSSKPVDYKECVPIFGRKIYEESHQQSLPDHRTSSSGSLSEDSLLQKIEIATVRASAQDSAGTIFPNVLRNVSVTTPVQLESSSLNASLDFTPNSGSDNVIGSATLTCQSFPKDPSWVDEETDSSLSSSSEEDNATILPATALDGTRQSKANRDGCCERTDSIDMEQTILQTQKQKSEQLLKTLERLREETRSVAATLEKFKKGVGPEANNVGGVFPRNRHVPATSMVFT